VLRSGSRYGFRVEVGLGGRRTPRALACIIRAHAWYAPPNIALLFVPDANRVDLPPTHSLAFVRVEGKGGWEDGRSRQR